MRIYGGSLALSWHIGCSVEVGGDSSAASLLMAGIRGALDPSTAAFRTDRRGGCWLLFYQSSFHGGGALFLQKLLPGTLMEAAVVHSRPFQGILSDTEPPPLHNMLPGS